MEGGIMMKIAVDRKVGRKIINCSCLLLVLLIGLSVLCAHGLAQDRDILTAEEREWLKKHEGQLRIAPDSSFAPIEFFDEKGNFQGISADYVALLEKKLQIKFQILQIENWAENVQKAKNRDFEIWSAVAPTPERREYMLFTYPHIEIVGVLIVSNDRKGKFSLDSMNKETIGVVDGYFTHNYLLENYPEANIRLVRDTSSGLKDVASKKLDVIFGDIATASYYMEKEGLTNLRVAGYIDMNYGLVFASRSDWPILNRILEKGLHQITKREKIPVLRKWIQLEQPGLYLKRP